MVARLMVLRDFRVLEFCAGCGQWFFLCSKFTHLVLEKWNSDSLRSSTLYMRQTNTMGALLHKDKTQS